MTRQETDETEKITVDMLHASGKEPNVSERPNSRKRWGLSGWFIALLFAEPVVLW